MAKSAERLVEGVDFVVVDGVRAEILDNLNGRTRVGQRWSNGLHEALESRLDLTIRPAQETIASTTMRRYLRSYRSVSGMTGTAWQSRGLIRNLYRMRVVRIPTRQLGRLEIRRTEVYGSTGAWMTGLADQIVARRAAINPELVLLKTPLQVELFAEMLRERGVDVQVLSADGRRILFEDAVTAAAGMPHAVTVATNIIGRGTDILLGGRGIGPFRRGPAAPTIETAGGLRVTTASLFESARAIRQGFGRAARQGERGSAGLVVALDDPLLTRFGDPVELARLREEFGDSAAPIPAERIGSLVDDAVAAAQQASERALRSAIRGRTTTESEFVRTLDEGRTVRTGAQEATLTRLGNRIDGLQRQLATGRAALVRSVTGGTTGPALHGRVTDLQSTAAQLAELVHEYRSISAAVDGMPAPAAPVQASPATDRAAAGLLGVDAVTIGAARDQIAAGDLDAAGTTLLRTASGARAMAEIPGLWAGADFVLADALQAVTALDRTLAGGRSSVAGMSVARLSGARSPAPMRASSV